MSLREFLKSIPERIKNIPNSTRQAILDYQESFHKGREKFGPWWTVFHLSMWAFVAIFMIAAILILVVYLPRAEMLLL